MLRLILKTLSWSIIAAFAVPTTLILVSWNAIPGSSTYSLKVGLEKVILGVTPSDSLKSSLQIKYTARRFDEVEKVLGTSYANEGINNFNNQLMASVNSVKSISNSTQKNTQALALVNTLKNISQKIETEKKTFLSNPSPTKISTVTSMPTSPPITNNEVVIPTPTPIIIPTSTSTPSNEEDNPPSGVSDQLDDTQETIQEIIDELEDQIQQTQIENSATNGVNFSNQNDDQNLNSNPTPVPSESEITPKNTRSNNKHDKRIF